MHVNRNLGAFFGALLLLVLSQCVPVEVEAVEIISTPIWGETRPGVWTRYEVYEKEFVRLTYRKQGDVEHLAVTLPCPNSKKKYTVVWERGELFGTSISCAGKFTEHNPMRLEELFTNLPRGDGAKNATGFVPNASVRLTT